MSIRHWFAFLRRDRDDADLDEEIRAHLAMAARDRIANGESPHDAAYAARRDFGNVGHIRDVTREMWGGIALDRVVQDLRLAARSLRKTPAFSITALLTLALGIGLTTTIFSVVNGVVLRSLPYPNADRLVTVCEQFPGASGDWCSISPPNAEDIATQSRSIDAIGIARSASARMATADGGSVSLSTGIATPGVFAALGVRPEAGRLLEPADVTGDAGNVAIITHEMWQAQFAGERDIIGRTISLDHRAVTIVGVMPPHFVVPQLDWIGLWRPVDLDPRDETNRAWHGFVGFARLKAGVSLDAARSDLRRIETGLRAEHFTDTPGWALTVGPLSDFVIGGARRTLLLFLGAVSLVLLVACANVANLMLARASARRREFALRAALGAGRIRLVRTLLAEALTLSLGGAALGVALAVGAVKAFKAMAPDTIPRVGEVRIDMPVLAFTLALSVVCTILFGILPSLRAADVDPATGLREGTRTVTRRSRVGSALVVGELALALVLLTGASLLTRTFQALEAWSPGFEESHLLVFSLMGSQQRYSTDAQIAGLWGRVQQSLATIPGVTSASETSAGPLFGGGDGSEEIRAPGYTGEKQTASWFNVSPGYFATLGLPIVRGRDLDARDNGGSAPVALVNETLARRMWPNEDAIGKRITVMRQNKPEQYDVVGVVRDIPPLHPGTPTDAQLYWSVNQQPRWFMYFVLRTSVPPASVISSVRRTAAQIDNELAPSGVRAFPEIVASKLVSPRFLMALLMTFGLAALLLAAIGTYGLLAYLVSKQQREIGIRMALGAARSRVLWEVLRNGMQLAALGVVFGAIGSFAAGRMMASLVAGVPLRDLVSVGTATLVLLAAALLACVVPATRASRTSPLIAMSGE